MQIVKQRTKTDVLVVGLGQGERHLANLAMCHVNLKSAADWWSGMLVHYGALKSYIKVKIKSGHVMLRRILTDQAWIIGRIPNS